MVCFETSDLKNIGKGLTGFGMIFTLVGIMLFFDRGFLVIGNIFLLLGVILTFGPNYTLQFFLKPQNYKGTLPLAVGFVFVITGWPIVGMFVEACCFIFLFRGFWPTLVVSLRKLPILNMMLRYSYESKYYGRLKGKRVPV
ncbi:hypothetical protein ACS0TY_020200 [Phlomoides rotata]